MANRVAVIQEVAAEWRHVPGVENPADIASRGVLCTKDLEGLWKFGPNWLLNEEDWPADSVGGTVEEEKKTVFPAQVLNVQEEDEFDTWKDAVAELGETELLKVIQASEFRTEIAELRAKKCVSRKSALWTLNPILDEDEVLRVGGRLNRADIPVETKFPAVLPATNRLVVDLMKTTHEEMQHASVNTVLTSLRERFWIVRARKVMKSLKRKCLTCVRYDTVLPVNNVVFAPLPKDRVTFQKAFTSVGTDYAGPILVNSPEKKAYILLFVCSASRAVDFEVVATLSTDDFLMAFRRFVARKAACPRIVRSDNAMTFVKASKMLPDVDWRFNPPASPWWGGQFESFVKLLKRPLRKVLGGSFVSISELETIVLEIERSVNSRPLTRLSDDPGDAPPLTPFHLMGKLPDDNVAEEIQLDAEQMTRRLKYVTKLATDCRKRWEKEYLTSLVQRSKRAYSRGRSPVVGDQVLVVLEHKARMFWPIGVITRVFPGKDGVVRAVETRTKGGVFVRPIQKIVLLEMDLENEFIDEASIDGISDVDETLGNEDVVSVDEDDGAGEADVQQSDVVTRAGRKVRRRTVLDL